MPVTFGGLIKQKRFAAGLSQEELGEKVGLTKAQISRIESNKQGTKSATAKAILGALGIAGKAANDALLLLAKAEPPEADPLEEVPADMLRYISDPDVQEMVKYYVGTPEELRPFIKNTAKKTRDAGDLAREMEDARVLGRRADFDENQSSDTD